MITYGLGTVNQNLPGYVVMLDPRGGPTSGQPNWSSGYMPAAFQGTVFRTSDPPILNLKPPVGQDLVGQRAEIDLINFLNQQHLQSRPGYSELSARIASYELAFKLQTEAPEALDLSQESAETLEMYGVNAPKPDWHFLSDGTGYFWQTMLDRSTYGRTRSSIYPDLFRRR